MQGRLFYFLTALVIAGGITACGGGEGKSSDPLGTDSITFGDASGSAVIQVDPNGSVQLTAKVKDAAGKAVAGREVTFAFVANASGATLTSTTVGTNSAGEAAIIYRAGATSGSDIVRAIISNGARMDVSITVGGGTGTKIALAGAPTSLTAGQHSIITATVTNSAGTPMSNQMVTFAFTANNSGAALTALNGGVTDVSGKAVALYTAGSANPTSGVEDTIQAGASGSAAVIILTRTVTGGGVNLSLASSVSSLTAGQNTLVTATVTDGASIPVSGQTVTFTISTNNSGAAITTVSGTTDASGRAIAQYTAGANNPAAIVQDTVLASVSGSVAALVITRTVGGTTGFQIGVTATPASVAAGAMSIIVAQVTTAGGTAVSGQVVTFTLIGGNVPSGATLSPLNGGITDAAGKALAIFTEGSLSPGQAVQDIVSTAVPGATAAAIVTRLATSGAGNRISSLTANPSTLGSSNGNSIVTATVVGNDGTTPAPGVTVSFSIVTGSGSIDPSTTTVVTGSDGKANAIFTGPGGIAGGEAVVRAQFLAAPGGDDAVVIIRWN